MMCLGWSTKQNCATRGTVEIAADGTATQVTGSGLGGPGVGECPNITWFWVAAGTLLVGLLTGKREQKAEA